MTPAQTALLNTLLGTGKATFTSADFEVARKTAAANMSGSDRDKLFKGFGTKTVTRAQVEAAILIKPVEPPKPVPPAPAPPAPPVTPPAPPITPAPTGLRLLRNEELIPGPNGMMMDVQNGNKPWSAMTDEQGYFRFELRDKYDQRPSEAKTTKRRSEVGRIVVPPGAAYSVFSARIKIAPQAFLDNMQWVFLQRHKGKPDPGDDKGEHPDLAFRLEKGGKPMFSVCGSDQKPLLAPMPKSTEYRIPRAWKFDEWQHVEIRCQEGQWAELWVEGELWQRHVGKVGYINSTPPYWKVGVYNSQGSNETTVVEVKDIALVP